MKQFYVKLYARESSFNSVNQDEANRLRFAQELAEDLRRYKDIIKYAELSIEEYDDGQPEP